MTTTAPPPSSSGSLQTVQDFIGTRLETLIGAGRRFDDRDMLEHVGEEVMARLAPILSNARAETLLQWGKTPLSWQELVVTAAILGLDRKDFSELVKAAKREYGKIAISDIRDDNHFTPDSIQETVGSIIDDIHAFNAIIDGRNDTRNAESPEMPQISDDFFGDGEDEEQEREEKNTVFTGIPPDALSTVSLNAGAPSDLNELTQTLMKEYIGTGKRFEDKAMFMEVLERVAKHFRQPVEPFCRFVAGDERQHITQPQMLLLAAMFGLNDSAFSDEMIQSELPLDSFIRFSTAAQRQYANREEEKQSHERAINYAAATERVDKAILACMVERGLAAPPAKKPAAPPKPEHKQSVPDPKESLWRKQVGKLLKELREEAGLSWVDMERTAKVDEVAIRHCEAGDVSSAHLTLIKICLAVSSEEGDKDKITQLARLINPDIEENLPGYIARQLGPDGRIKHCFLPALDPEWLEKQDPKKQARLLLCAGREFMGQSRSQFARTLDISEDLLRQMENGTRGILADKQERLAKLFSTAKGMGFNESYFYNVCAISSDAIAAAKRNGRGMKKGTSTDEIVRVPAAELPPDIRPPVTSKGSDWKRAH